MSLLSRLFACALALLAVARLAAQTPRQIVVAKLDRYLQTSATEQTPAAVELVAQVAFVGSPPPGAAVQLRGPSGATLTLQRKPDGSYEGVAGFETRAALDAAFPDGVLGFTVGDGPALNIAVFTGQPVPPVRINNFDELQAWPNGNVVVNWGSLPRTGGNAAALFNLKVSREDGSTVFETPEGYPADASSLTISNVPLQTTLAGRLLYASLSRALINNGATTIATGRGFAVEFPLRTRVAAPVILRQPVGTVAYPDDTVQLNVDVSGIGPWRMQWSKDGVPIPGATHLSLELRNMQADKAGSYTFTVSNAGGSVQSEAAFVGLAPSYRLAVHAGSLGLYGSGDGPALTARFSCLSGLALDRAGNLYAADFSSHTLRKISADGMVTTLAGLAGAQGARDGAGAEARFTNPSGVALDDAGNIYVTEFNAVRKVSPSGVVTTLAGASGVRGVVDGAGSAARFGLLLGIAVDASGNVFVSDALSHTIRRITPAGVVTTVAGRTNTSGFVNGSAVDARFNQPAGLAFGPGGILYISDGENRVIRSLTPSGQVATVAEVHAGYSLTDLAVDASGNLYSSVWTGAILRYSPLGAPNGYINFVSYRELIPGYSNSFNPKGMAVAPDGTLYIADAGSYAILRATWQPGIGTHGLAIVEQPKSHVLTSGGGFSLHVTATGPSQRYLWRKDGQPVIGATSSSLHLASTTPADAGEYTVVVSNGLGAVESQTARIAFLSAGAASRLANLSIRARTGPGDRVLTLGAVAGGGGAEGGAVRTLIRGIGPTLRDLGVSAALADPRLRVLRGQTAIAENDNWGATPALAQTFASAGAFPLAAASLDAALESSLPAGAYSIQIAPAGDTSGVALAEVYDLSGENATGPRLVNLSTRAEAGVGADILIAGFVIRGSTSKTLLLRAVGPSLRRFGVERVLANPQLRLFSGERVLAENDNWNRDNTLERAAQRAGAFSLEYGEEAVLLVTLPPGSYSAQVSGVRDTTGLALVEIYELP